MFRLFVCFLAAHHAVEAFTPSEGSRLLISRVGSSANPLFFQQIFHATSSRPSAAIMSGAVDFKLEDLKLDFEIDDELKKEYELFKAESKSEVHDGEHETHYEMFDVRHVSFEPRLPHPGYRAILLHTISCALRLTHRLLICVTAGLLSGFAGAMVCSAVEDGRCHSYLYESILRPAIREQCGLLWFMVLCVGRSPRFVVPLGCELCPPS